MQRVLIAAFSALLLSGCVAQWPSNKTGARWTMDGAPREPSNHLTPSPYAGGRLGAPIPSEEAP